MNEYRHNVFSILVDIEKEPISHEGNVFYVGDFMERISNKRYNIYLSEDKYNQINTYLNHAFIIDIINKNGIYYLEKANNFSLMQHIPRD